MESKVTPNLFSNALSQEKTTINIKLWRVRIVFPAVAQFWDCFSRKDCFRSVPRDFPDHSTLFGGSESESCEYEYIQTDSEEA